MATVSTFVSQIVMHIRFCLKINQMVHPYLESVTQGVQMKFQGVHAGTFNENLYEKERIWVILGCAISKIWLQSSVLPLEPADHLSRRPRQVKSYFWLVIYFYNHF